MRLTHKDYRFSITIHIDDRAVLYCLRALTQISQRKGDVRIPSGGTKDPDWEQNRHQVTFRFTEAEYRQKFVEEAERILPRKLWREIEGTRSGSNPATRQSVQHRKRRSAVSP